MINTAKLDLYIKGARLVLGANIFLGLYHRLRRIVIQNKANVLTLPEKISENALLLDKDAQAVVKYFEENKKQKKQLLEAADNFCEGRIRVYQKDIILEKFTVEKFQENNKSPDVYCKDLRFYWEIYRARYVFTIAIAYRLTHDEKYAASLMEYVKRWKQFSPICSNYMRYNGMEAAIKIINLSWLELFLAENSRYQSEVRSILVDCIIQHARYIDANYDIPLYGLESNHSIFCAGGLIYAALLFPEYKESRKWYRFGMRVVERALKTQFSKDGVNFESSPQYHRLVFELLVILLAMLHRNQKTVPDYLPESIKKIGEALISLKHTDNSIAKFGDNDGGRLFYSLDEAGRFSNIEYFDWFCLDAHKPFFETLIFENIPQVKNLLSNKSKKFRIGDYITYKNSQLSLIITANNIGTRGKGNHQHNDFLSFELYTKTSPFIVDRWSFCYTGDKEIRNRDRSTYIHNNIQIDGREIVEFEENRLFEMLGDIKVKINKIEDDTERWLAAVQHDGYKDLENGPQKNVRTFEVLKGQNVVKVKDFLNGIGNHSATLALLIPKRCWSIAQKGQAVVFTNDEGSFTIESTMGEFEVEESFIGQNFLDAVPAYLCFVKTDYRNSLSTELTIQYEQK